MNQSTSQIAWSSNDPELRKIDEAIAEEGTGYSSDYHHPQTQTRDENLIETVGNILQREPIEELDEFLMKLEGLNELNPEYLTAFRELAEERRGKLIKSSKDIYLITQSPKKEETAQPEKLAELINFSDYKKPESLPKEDDTPADIIELANRKEKK